MIQHLLFDVFLSVAGIKYGEPVPNCSYRAMMNGLQVTQTVSVLILWSMGTANAIENCETLVIYAVLIVFII